MRVGLIGIALLVAGAVTGCGPDHAVSSSAKAASTPAATAAVNGAVTKLDGASAPGRVVVTPGHSFSPDYDQVLPVDASGVAVTIWKSDKNAVKLCQADAPTTNTEGASYMATCLARDTYTADARRLAGGAPVASGTPFLQATRNTIPALKEVDDAGVEAAGRATCSDIAAGRGLDHVINDTYIALSMQEPFENNNVFVFNAVQILCPEYQWMLDKYSAGDTTVGSGDPH